MTPTTGVCWCWCCVCVGGLLDWLGGCGGGDVWGCGDGMHLFDEEADGDGDEGVACVFVWFVWLIGCTVTFITENPESIRH